MIGQHMMSVFIRETKDAIEQLYGSEITDLFPNYSVFWEAFVGDPKKSVPLPYGLVYPQTMLPEKQGEIDEVYQEICMAHYSLFCHLAGAHFQLESLLKSVKLDDPRRKYFEHWEAFEVCYIHLGSALNQMYHVWGLLFLLKGEIERDRNGKLRGAKGKLKNYLSANGHSSVCQNIDQLDEEIKKLRDNIIHYSRGASELHFGEYYIPLEITQETWQNQHQSEEWQETSRKVRSDIEATERLINKIHTFLIKELGDLLKSEKIKMDR